jgi:hypothetical protein
MRWLLITFAALSALLSSDAAFGRRRTNPLVVFPEKPERLRAVRYARMASDRCLAELRSRGVEFEPAPPLRRVETPIVLRGDLRGVVFARTFEPKTAPVPVMDCRLALALDDLAVIASDRGIQEIRYSSIHRQRGRRGGRGHAAGTAIDIDELVLRDGTVLNVLHDFEKHRIGAKTCGADAPRPKGAKAVQLRDVVCAVDEAASFNLVLTPHYDHRHRDHLHLEVRGGIDWFLTQ